MVMRLALPCALLMMSTVAAAQTAPPIHGVTGTIATDTSIGDEHGAAHGIARGASKLVPHGRAQTSENPLDVLTAGKHVIVQDAEASRAGVVIDVNRSRRQITVRFADRHTETLRVRDRSAGEQGVHVVVTLADQPNATRYDFKPVL